MKVVVTGSTGLIGTALVRALETRGDGVTRMVRRSPGTGEARWDPEAGQIEAAALEGHDAVVHLAGAGIGDHRWSEDHKRAVLDSRVKGTTLLASTVAALTDKPRIMASGSAMGYYGLRGDEVLTEDAAAGTGFLADVCEQWEAATAPAEDAGVRVAHLRTGLVLSPHGGALKQMLLPFKLGLGGRIGSGRQWWSWISIDDEVNAILHIIDTSAPAGGAFNLTAPNPVTNEEFTRTLNRVLRRPTLLPTPTFALKAMFGSEAVDEMFLGGQRVVPARLQADGYAFRHPELEGALRHLVLKGA
ncbi:MAG TPA: TIGR01777 family oxidoreductase [Acidimicrobiales bacterium]|nr:TIGR01777 family oxidoreductase [Acidimicrobiales bacterium]